MCISEDTRWPVWVYTHEHLWSRVGGLQSAKTKSAARALAPNTEPLIWRVVRAPLDEKGLFPELAAPTGTAPVAGDSTVGLSNA